MQRSFCNLWLALGLISFAHQVGAEGSQFDISGSMRVRAESKSTTEFTNFAGTRLRVDAKIKPNEKVNIFLQPQFSKAWGEPEIVPTNATTNTSNSSSGALNDTGLDVHQAYLNYQLIESLNFTVGRKELNYGDQLLVGGVGWSNVGRAFDLVLANYNYSFGNAEAFSAKVKDSNVSSGGVGDKDFSGLYLSHQLGDWMQNADLYAFLSEDRSNYVSTATSAYGLRSKSVISDFDYRIEGTLEDVKGATQRSGASQWDVELGYIVVRNKKLRLSGEYFAASENFDQLYPTGHKWLGFADLFSRRNLKGYRLGASAQFSEDFNLSFDYHDFQRAETGAPAYKFSGAAYGSAGTDSNIASEIDLVASYKLAGGLTLEAGACRGEPKEYLKANGNPDVMSFYYLQVSTLF